jgi:hypothetical protein
VSIAAAAAARCLLQNFAIQKNLQVTVKGTGHDYNGRCSADGSLNINTRLLNDVFFDVPQNKVRHLQLTPFTTTSISSRGSSSTRV